MKNCNKKLFPKKLISGSVKSQRDLENAFKRNPSLSKRYVQIAVHWKKYRDWYEKNWVNVCKYLDKNFVDKFKSESEHIARSWEFHIATVLLNKGFILKEKTWDHGPDFCIELSDGKNLWIEAITCELGDVDPVEPYPEIKPGIMYSSIGNIEDINRPKALRITNAIGKKFEKFKDYLKNPDKTGVRENDCLLIAVNGHLIQHNSYPEALFKRAVFGQGPDMYKKNNITGRLEGPFYKPVPTIKKRYKGKDKSIPANFMEMDEFSIISSVIYSGNTANHSWSNGYEVGDDFLFAYHVNPNNPIPDKLFKFGKGIRKDVKNKAISVNNQ